MDTLFDPIKRPDCIGFMALNLAHPISFRPRIIEIAGVPRNPSYRVTIIVPSAVALDVYVGFDSAFVVNYVIGRAKTRELEKFAYKMGLIEVSAINGKVRPIDRRIVLDESSGLLKPLNPAEQFRRYAHFRLENLNEATLA